MRKRSNHLSDITRRNLLHGAAGVSSGLIIGGANSGCSKKSAPLEKRTADVVVVGAGLSGLVAARELLKAGVPSVMVVEARDRVGGLTISQEVAPGVLVDGGGSWARPEHTHILALAKELGVEALDASEDKGSPVVLFEGVRIAGFGRLFTREETKQLENLRKRLLAMAAALPAGSPWTAPRAAQFDELSMFNWLNENATTVWAKRELELAVDWTFGCQPEDISLFRFVATVKSQGGLESLIPLSDSEDVSFAGGSQQISLKMAESLGDRILLSSPVTKIIDEGSGPIRVETNRHSIECGRVIVAMMPADMRRIDFEPRLPDLKRGLITNWRGSPDYKAHIVYEKPFWRASNLNGAAIGDGEVIDFILDGTPPSGTPGILIAFGAGGELPSNERARKESVVEAIATYFGEEALEPIKVVEMDWYSQTWSSGCASPLGPNVLSKYGPALRPAIGRIHWAGSDTAYEFDGTMEGAVRSGEHAAAEVAKALRESAAIAAPAKSG